MTVKHLKDLVKRDNRRSFIPYEVEQWFDEMWKRPFSMLRPSFWPDMLNVEAELAPKVDIFEEGKEVVIKAELPGIKKSDVKVDLTGNMLTISGEKKMTEKVEREHYHKYERSHGSFCRRFELPGDLETDKIKAQMKDGVLEVRIPMSKEAVEKHKKIPIE